MAMLHSCVGERRTRRSLRKRTLRARNTNSPVVDRPAPKAQRITVRRAFLDVWTVVAGRAVPSVAGALGRRGLALLLGLQPLAGRLARRAVAFQAVGVVVVQSGAVLVVESAALVVVVGGRHAGHTS
jgi:hypothetical protein